MEGNENMAVSTTIGAAVAACLTVFAIVCAKGSQGRAVGAALAAAVSAATVLHTAAGFLAGAPALAVSCYVGALAALASPLVTIRSRHEGAGGAQHG